MMMSLSDAILKKDLPSIRQALQAGVDINEIDEYGFTPLIEAIIMDDVNVAEMLLFAGAQVDQQDMTGQTPLHWAVENNNVHLVKSLLERGASTQVYSVAGKPILLMPYLRRQKLLKTLLYQYGADLRFCQDYINTKMLGHRFELVGSASIVDAHDHFVDVNYEGFFLEFTLHALENSLHEFKFNFASRKLRHLEKSIEIAITALKNACKLIKYQQYLTDLTVHDHEIEKLLLLDLAIIPVAVEGHAMTFIRYKDLLVRCDRQENGFIDDAIEFFRIHNQSHFNTEFFKNLIYRASSTEYIHTGIERDLGLEKVGELMMPVQISGNCSWANIEAVIPAILYLLFQEKTDDTIFNKRMALSVFDQWRAWDQNRALHFCIESFKTASTARRAAKAEILGAILFQSCKADSADDLIRARCILSILALKPYQYIVKQYITTYCYNAKTPEGDAFMQLLSACGYALTS